MAWKEGFFSSQGFFVQLFFPSPSCNTMPLLNDVDGVGIEREGFALQSKWFKSVFFRLARN